MMGKSILSEKFNTITRNKGDILQTRLTSIKENFNIDNNIIILSTRKLNQIPRQRAELGKIQLSMFCGI